MWFYILFTVLPVGTWFAANQSNDIGIDVGQKFSELDRETQDMLHQAKHWKVDNRKYFATVEAPNTDNCFTYKPDCQPDYEHYVYEVPSLNKGQFFRVTFSYNYHVLSIEDSQRHTQI